MQVLQQQHKLTTHAASLRQHLHIHAAPPATAHAASTFKQPSFPAATALKATTTESTAAAPKRKHSRRENTASVLALKAPS